MRNRQRIRNSVFDDTANIITVTMEKFDFTVAGSGPGGYIEAVRVAQMGTKVAVVERDKPECCTSKFNGRDKLLSDHVLTERLHLG